MVKYCIENRVWVEIYEFLKTVKGLHSSNEWKLRRFLEAVFYITKSGSQWRMLPCHYGNWRTVHKRFKRWNEKEIWKNLMENFIEADLEYVMIDSTIIRANACAAGYEIKGNVQEALGRSKGGFTTKIHALVDALGNPLKFILTVGQRNDITQAEKLTKGFTDTIIIGDKGYDSDRFVRVMKDQGNDVVIPPRSNRKYPREYDEHLYEDRNLVERFFSKIKWYRRIASRFDKCAKTFLGFIYFVGALIWLK